MIALLECALLVPVLLLVMFNQGFIMKTIQTKYLPATGRKPSRVKAWSENVSVIVSYDSQFEGATAFWPAAKKLADKMNWCGTMISGGIENGYVFVFTDDDHFTI